MVDHSEDPALASGDDAKRPASAPQRTNRLHAEASLYLRQHDRNPVDWFPWSDEAIAKARDEDKPIFLSIGYSSCHWCHVMAHEVFEDEQVAELMNRFFVCVKVDREERPDLDAVYMEAVQALTGGGGWPLSVFLTPDLRPFFGGTYFPRDRFLALVNRVREVFSEHRDELQEKASELAARITELPRMVSEKMGGVAVDAALVDGAAAQAPAQYDNKWGGFEGEQKFPTPARWLFLLHHHRKSGEARTARLVELTLAAMASGGIYDHVGGGFHRYTVERTWLIPHFEKMLYDNVQLASLYLEAGVALRRPEFVAVGRDVLDFLLRDMTAPAGGVYSSFDADSGGEEGSFYVWDGDDLALALSGGDDARPLAALLGVEPGGNFEGGKSVLTRRADLAEIAKEHERPESEIAALFNRHRGALRAFRDQRPRPGLDTKVIASWNGLAITAFARGYAVTGDARYRDAATRTAAYLWRAHWREDGRLARTTNDGAAGPVGILDDHGFLACGLFDLYQVTGDADHLARALALVDLSRERFADPDGGFYMTAASAEAPLGRKVELFDSVIPSGNAAILHALIVAEAVTGRSAYRDEVERTLSRYAGLMQRAGLEMAWWHDAALRHLGPFYLVVVAGDPGAADTQALVAEASRDLPPHVVLVQVPAAGAAGELAAAAPAVTGKSAVGGRATAHVCEHGACQAPVTDPADLRRLLSAGWHR